MSQLPTSSLSSAVQTILIIDDDEELNTLLTSYLKQFNFDVVSAIQPSLGLEILQTRKVDMIVLDVMLPEKSGFEVCREIRKTSKTPIIMLTARGDLSDRVVGLELGADDYLPKPYEPRELVARIQSVLRRTQGHLVETESRYIESHDLIVDMNKASATLTGNNLDLTTAEFTVLKILIENVGRTLSRDELTQAMRGSQWDATDRTVDMVVSRLRHKLHDDSKNPVYLKTIWGEGYRFVGDIKNR